MTSVQIENIVGTGTLGIEVDVAVVSNDLEAYEVTYNPDNYHGLYVRLNESGPLITVYRTGKYIITGADSESELFDTKDQFLSLLNDKGILDRPEDDSFRVNNIVCTADLEYTIDLNRLSIALGRAERIRTRAISGFSASPSGASVCDSAVRVGQVRGDGSTNS